MSSVDVAKERQELIDNLPLVASTIISSVLMKMKEEKPTKFSFDLNEDDSKTMLKTIFSNLYYAGYAPFVAGFLGLNKAGPWPNLEDLAAEVDKVNGAGLLLFSLIKSFVQEGPRGME